MPLAPSSLDDAEKLTLHHPRILCLHGGGTNAAVFRVQCRRLIATLADHFRLVFAEGPYPSAPHPAIVQVYGDMGPFKVWLNPESRGEGKDDPSNGAAEIQAAIRRAIAADDAAGATGRLSAVLGFSQGATLAASLAWAQQQQQRRHAATRSLVAPLVEYEDARLAFCVLMAGSPRLLSLLDDADVYPACARAEGERIEIPSLHVHGCADPGLEGHRRLLTEWFSEGAEGGSAAVVVEGEHDHRVPIVGKVVEEMKAVIVRMAVETGVIESA